MSVFSQMDTYVYLFFLSYSKDGQMSFEHTHPPHENLCGNDRIELVNKYRKETYEKVVKKIFS